MGRKPADPDYGLPPLTFAEFARVLEIDEGAGMNWVMKTARPSSGRWGEWERGERPLPERLIRLYLIQRHRGAFAIPIGPTGEDPPPDGRGVVALEPQGVRRKKRSSRSSRLPTRQGRE